MILHTDQERQLERVAGAGDALAVAKRLASIATTDAKAAVSAAHDARVPLSRVAEAAGVQRSLIYRWLGEEAA
jgi:DNA-binding phage protein